MKRRRANAVCPLLCYSDFQTLDPYEIDHNNKKVHQRL